MVDINKIISVKNRDNGVVGYFIPDLDIRRQYQPGEVKQVRAEELIKLSYIPGGMTMIQDYLIITDTEMVQELLGDVEPEYYYSDEEVKELLLNGTVAQLRDCLKFAPAGTINRIKDLAVDYEISDLNKRTAILEATGFDVTRAIEINHDSAEDEKGEEVKVREAEPIKVNKEAAPKRQAATPQYKVVK